MEMDTADEILSRTEALLNEMAEANGITPENMTSICFTMTPDLHATFPAEAARRIGWKYVPVICMQELDIIHGMRQTIRVLMSAETDKAQVDIRHIYQERAVALREDLLTERDGHR